LQEGRIYCLHRIESNLSYSLLLNQKPSWGCPCAYW